MHHTWKPLFLALCFALLTSCQSISIRSDDDQTRLGIMQGPTTPQSTIITVLAPVDAKWTFQVSDVFSGGPKPKVLQRTETFDKSQWQIHQFNIDNIKPDHQYVITVRDKDKKIVDQRSFSALNYEKESYRFAVASCMDDSYEKEQIQIWPELISHGPDAIFMIGDNVYADHKVLGPQSPAPPKQMWRRFVTVRKALSIFKTQKLTPVFSIWDDHDYGVNNGNSGFKHKEQAARIFESFFPRASQLPFIERGPGLSSAVAFKGLGFLFLDNRSFRDPNKDGAHWGAVQENWLIKKLENTNPHILINGDQFFGGYHRFESYEGDHPKSFKAMIKKIGEANSTVALISGDRHLAEVMKIEPPEFPYTTYELTTSAIHANLFPGNWKKVPNKRQIAGKDRKFNYMILDFNKISSPDLEFTATVWGLKKERLIKKDLTIKKGKK